MAFHSKRVWSVARFDTVEQLAERLRGNCCLCNGFQLGDYLFLNDATCEDAVKEYAVCKRTDLEIVQLDSFTVGWMSHAELLQHIRDVAQGQYDNLNHGYEPIGLDRIEESEHHRCSYCR